MATSGLFNGTKIVLQIIVLSLNKSVNQGVRKGYGKLLTLFNIYLNNLVREGKHLAYNIMKQILNVLSFANNLYSEQIICFTSIHF